MSVENFLDLGYEKISRSSRITAGLKLREAAGVFSKVSPARAGRKPSGRTGCGLVTGIEQRFVREYSTARK